MSTRMNVSRTQAHGVNESIHPKTYLHGWFWVGYFGVREVIYIREESEENVLHSHGNIKLILLKFDFWPRPESEPALCAGFDRTVKLKTRALRGYRLEKVKRILSACYDFQLFNRERYRHSHREQNVSL